MTQATVEQAMDVALGHRRAGRLAEAVAAFGRVVELLPGSAEAYNNLGIALREAGRRDEAIAAYRRAVALAPEHAAAHNNLGNVLRETGQIDEAIAALLRAVALGPASAAAYNNLGVALHQAQRLDEAIIALTRAIALRPDYAPAYNNLASALADAHRHDEALVTHHRAIALQPDSALAHDSLGRTLRLHGELDAAIAAYRRAIELDPEDVQTHYHLGNTLRQAGRADEAVAALNRAVSLDSESALAYESLGNALGEAGRLGDAIAALERSLQLCPDAAGVHNNLGVAWYGAGRIDEALACFRRAVERDPDSVQAASNLLFTAHFHPDRDARTLLAEHRRWAGHFAAPLAAEAGPHDNDRNPDRRLRVGFVSPDFTSHPVGRFLRPLFTYYDRGRTELFAYSDVRVTDAVTHELKALAGGWLGIVGMSDAEVARRIRRDRIDILVDLALHTAGNRMLVFARRPAPVQATMLGLPSTTGLSTIDYRITDPYLDPPEYGDADYSERSLRLPHGLWCYQPDPDAPPVAELPARTRGVVTFGCLNQFAKVNRAVLELWVKILQQLPGSRLVLHCLAGTPLDTVHALLQTGGIARDRVEIAPKVQFRAYLERYHSLDLCLDPFPFGGATTTLDALWMGVPVITLAGRTAVGRGGVSILTNVGLTELIARTPQQYVDIAVDWANNPDRLAAVRGGLRKRMQASPLMDGKQYAADVEAALRRMWKAWCSR